MVEEQKMTPFTACMKSDGKAYVIDTNGDKEYEIRDEEELDKIVESNGINQYTIGLSMILLIALML